MYYFSGHSTKLTFVCFQNLPLLLFHTTYTKITWLKVGPKRLFWTLSLGNIRINLLFSSCECFMFSKT